MHRAFVASGNRLNGRGGGRQTPALTLPQRHSHSPKPAPTAFPIASNRPPTAFAVPCNRSAAALELCPQPPLVAAFALNRQKVPVPICHKIHKCSEMHHHCPLSQGGLGQGLRLSTSIGGGRGAFAIHSAHPNASLGKRDVQGSQNVRGLGTVCPAVAFWGFL